MDCPTRKAQHSYTQAKRLAKRASRSYDKPMSAYLCQCCGAWHVGTSMRQPQPMRLINSNHELRLI